MVRTLSETVWWMRVVWDYPDIYYHIVPEVFVSRDQCIALVILEAHALGSSLVEAVEVLDRGDDRVGGVMREDLDSHRQTCAIIGRFIKDEFECDMLRGRTQRRRIVRGGRARVPTSVVQAGWGSGVSLIDVFLRLR